MNAYGRISFLKVIIYEAAYTNPHTLVEYRFLASYAPVGHLSKPYLPLASFASCVLLLFHHMICYRNYYLVPLLPQCHHAYA